MTHKNMGTAISKTPKAASLDWLKWLVVFACLSAGIWANSHYSQIDWALRLAGWVVLVCMLLWVVIQTSIGRTLLQFSNESRMELRKVVWPTRQETVQTTLIVIMMVFIMSIILWGLDTFLLWTVSLLTGQKG